MSAIVCVSLRLNYSSLPLPLLLRNNNRVIGLKFDILAEIFAFDDVLVVDTEYLFFTVFVTHEDDFFFGSPLGKATGQSKGLQHGQALDKGVFTGVDHLSQDVKTFAAGVP